MLTEWKCDAGTAVLDAAAFAARSLTFTPVTFSFLRRVAGGAASPVKGPLPLFQEVMLSIDELPGLRTDPSAAYPTARLHEQSSACADILFTVPRYDEWMTVGVMPESVVDTAGTSWVFRIDQAVCPFETANMDTLYIGRTVRLTFRTRVHFPGEYE